MATKIAIQHKGSGLLKEGYYGFSWTYLFFGWFVPVIRGEIIIGAVHLLITLVTFGIWQVILAFFYNQQYMTRMLTDGWTLKGTDQEILAARAALHMR